MPDAHSRAGVLSKRALVTASHAVERAALADGTGEDTVVFALFQRLPYFEREREVYSRIARRAAVTVVGMVDSGRPDLPHGVTPVLLRPDEPMAREWSVAVLSPTFGASVVAQDLDEVDPQAATVERARLFHGRWGLRRDEAYAEVVRLRDAMGDRLPPAVRRRVDEVLASVETPAAVDVESRAEAALRHVAVKLDEARDRALPPPATGPAVDPETGLDTPAGMAPWLGDATDTVPLGLVLVAVDDLAAVERRHGPRVRMHTEQNIADLLREGLRPLDRAVRLGPREFLVVQPAVPAADLTERSRRLERRLAALHTTYPFVELHPRTTTLLTRRRPLPLQRLRAQLREVPEVALWPPSQGSLPLPPKPRPVPMRSGAGHWFR
ncbi:DICT sensory domain-containing protein [Amycolatopsis sp. Hca4]|uniref:DICT sensory domain-containing protein n=1 Tax=unclassified Amycolatopsis TaxID=2618356 RepID=UPI0015913835|nr:DICT sensory domain-containing protein [Amycolatopsis sp. Hca4]QKV73540.1 sensor protein [Amycolatopsis sp. Hca4]